MSELPTGTVTFLFTDIEGSTRLVDRLGDGYRSVLEKHQELLREVFSAAGGVEVSTEGDSFFVVFESPSRAVAAAAEAQRALAAYPWPDGASVRVRVGLHTGEGVPGGDNYVGPDLHRGARIAATGHGGQIVASSATRALVEHTSPEGVTFVDLGEHRLKDLPRAERLFQVVVEGLPSEFPSLRSMDARPNNLPSQLTSFVGRRREIDEVKEALGRTRLLTLTGPGGAGKTRLSLQVASELLPEYGDGAFFAALAPITDTSLVMPTVATALGLGESPERSPLEQVSEHLRDKELLLVLDNFEQVIDAASEVGQLLTLTEKVRVLVTSREPLGLHGEGEYPVPPLGLPDTEHLPSLEALSQFESVALFIERAASVKPDFGVTNDNAPAVAEICARLDGLPLAIELAAARVKVLTPQAMLARLEHRLQVLSRGSRDVPTRQQTLRDAIGWSYDLLEEDERALFARLSVFVGGFSLEVAETVCNPDGELGLDTLDGVASLTNKSLLRQMESEVGESRFFMLETIREYAGERLAQSADHETVVRRHAAHFLEVAERAAPELTGAAQVEWLDIVATEHDNLRAAIEWGAARDLPSALRIGAALWRFWQIRGHLREGRERLERLLDLPGAREDPAVAAAALEAAGGVAYWMGDFRAARERYQECLEFRRDTGDRRGIAEATYNLSFAHGLAPPPLQDLEMASKLLEEAQALFEELGDREGIAKTTWGLATAAYEVEDWERVAELASTSVEMYRGLDSRFGLAWALHLLGLALTLLDRPDEAQERLEEALRMFLEAGDRSALALLLGDFAILAASLGEGDRAIRLAGAAAAVEEAVGTGLLATSEGVTQRMSGLRELLPAVESERVFQEGRAMAAEDAAAYALGEEQGQASTP
jgi:predicted ATPase/class 3 adenylate cyclase